MPGNGIYGQTAGHFGIVNGVMYYDNNSALGRAALTDNGTVVFPAAYGTGPWQVTATNAAVATPLASLGFPLEPEDQVAPPPLPFHQNFAVAPTESLLEAKREVA